MDVPNQKLCHGQGAQEHALETSKERFGENVPGQGRVEKIATPEGGEEKTGCQVEAKAKMEKTKEIEQTREETETETEIWQEESETERGQEQETSQKEVL